MFTLYDDDWIFSISKMWCDVIWHYKVVLNEGVDHSHILQQSVKYYDQL